MRTEAEIQRQLEEAYAELEQEHKRRQADDTLNFPCRTCRFSEGIRCSNPLVAGFGDATPNHDWVKRDRLVYKDSKAHLCGEERVLWRALPRPMWAYPRNWPDWVQGASIAVLIVGGAITTGIGLAVILG